MGHPFPIGMATGYPEVEIGNGEYIGYRHDSNQLFDSARSNNGTAVMQFDRFNAKVRAKISMVEQALNDPATRYEVVIAYTGSSGLATPSKRDMDDLAREMNDTSEVVSISVLNQSVLHNSLVSSVAGEPINMEIGLKSWGRKESPHEAYYGQISGEAIADWWSKYRTRLFARNLRSMLGETEVNVEMRQTLQGRAEEFWYFNNGITIVARRARRAMAGGTSTDFATFHCDDVSIVNGAQTVGTIGKFSELNPAAVAPVYVPVRIIVRGDDQMFGEEVTRTNNRQNRIENRDFVALDPEQNRIRQELAVDGIDYQLVRSESIARSDTAFDLVEATTALACASGTVKLPVQAKREIGKLWEDLNRAPYKELFNGSVPGLKVWRCVQIQRRVDKGLSLRLTRGGTIPGKLYPVATHGNRIVAGLVFDNLPVSRFLDPVFDIETVASEPQIQVLVDRCLDGLVAQVEINYPVSIIPTLFKNLKKCEHLVGEVKKSILPPQ